jgi:hypothetical protein
MTDVAHTFGNDLTVDATGDIAVSSGSQLGQERVLRRLLTNPGAVLWALDYGAGLARFIGQPAAVNRITAVTRAQMGLEAAVAQTPPADISVVVQASGTVTENIRYVDAETGDPVTLILPSIGS